MTEALRHVFLALHSTFAFPPGVSAPCLASSSGAVNIHTGHLEGFYSDVCHAHHLEEFYSYVIMLIIWKGFVSDMYCAFLPGVAFSTSVVFIPF